MTDEMRRGVCPACGTPGVLVLYRVTEDGPGSGGEIPVGAVCPNPRCRNYDPRADSPAPEEPAR